jgi:thioredoxin 2
MSTPGIDLTADGLVVTCAACGQKNRLRFEALGRRGRCGKCHADLPLPAGPVDVPSTAAFDALVAHSALPVLVDFWAEWCGPCRMVAPELVKVARARAGRTLVAKVDTEALPDVAARLQIRSIPTMMVFAGGSARQRTSGALPAAAIEEFLDRASG